METTTLLIVEHGYGEAPDVAGVPIASLGYGGVLSSGSDYISCVFADNQLDIEISNIIPGSLELYINNYLIKEGGDNVLSYSVAENAGINGANISVELSNWHNTRIRNILKSSFPRFMGYKTIEANVRVGVRVKGWKNSDPRDVFCYFDLPRAIL
jgi:hypothetical protein